MYYRISILLGIVTLLCSSGCSGSAGGATAEGKAFLLDTEPADAMSVVELKTGMMTGLVLGEATIVGRVGSGQDETWSTDRAAFMLRDLDLKVEAHDHGDGGNHDNCNFCKEAKSQALQSMALVRMVDENGSVIETDARKLLGLKENHIIVATGEGIDEDGTLVFNAKKIFIRR